MTRLEPLRLLLCAAMLSLPLGVANATSATLSKPREVQVTSSTRYLFFYFHNEQHGIRLAWSGDGLKWTPVNDGKPVFDIHARDPFVLAHPDGSYYLALATSPHTVLIRRSADLIEWSEPWTVEVMENEPGTRNVWAPELFHDPASSRVMLLWSSTIPGRYPETDDTGDDGYNHRCYYKTSTDMRTWSPTKLLYDPGFNNIDATIVRNGERYMMVLKDERLNPVMKTLRVAWAGRAEGPYGELGGPITPPGRSQGASAGELPGADWAEGPAVIRIGEYWMLYFDHYFGNRYGAMRSRDGIAWENVGDRLSMPERARHGSVIEVPAQVLDRILQHWER